MNAHIVTFPGDGIGPEVTAAAVAVLRRIADDSGHHFIFTEGLIGGAALRVGLDPVSADTLTLAQSADAILLGAVGDPAFDHRPPGQRPESALLQLRSGLGLYANLRPARTWPGLEHAGPLKSEILEGTDLLVVRELTGGLYYGKPQGLAADGQSAFNTMRYSVEEIERVAHCAFALASQRRREVVSVDKSNVLEVSQLWRQTVTRIADEYPDVTLTHEYVDTAAMKLVMAPASFDVLLTENLFGDILSDEAGAVCGSLGLLPSASLGEGPGLLEPVHGSAPALAGRDIANPVGAILSAAMLLEYGLGLREDAARVERAVAATLNARYRTAELCSPGYPVTGTIAFTKAVIDRI